MKICLVEIGYQESKFFILVFFFILRKKDNIKTPVRISKNLEHRTFINFDLNQILDPLHFVIIATLKNRGADR